MRRNRRIRNWAIVTEPVVVPTPEPQPPMEEFKMTVAEWRATKNLTVNALARTSGISKAMITEYDNKTIWEIRDTQLGQYIIDKINAEGKI